MINPEWLRITVASVVLNGLCFAVVAQEPNPAAKDNGKPAKFFEFKSPGGRGTGGGVLDALRDKKVQQEIGLFPVQIQELQALSDQVSQDLQAAVQEFQSLSKMEQNARKGDFQRDMTERVRTFEREINDILAPAQQERLRQTVLQMRMKRDGTSMALTSPEIMRELELTEAAATRIREQIRSIEAGYHERIIDLQAAMQREIIAQFTTAQQQKLKSLIGPMMQDQPKQSGAPKGPQNQPEP